MAAVDPDTRPSTSEIVRAVGVAAGGLDDEGRRVALATYRLLADGEPVTDGAVAEASGVSVGEVAGYWAEWPGVFRNDAGAIVGFWGLALAPLEPTYGLADAGTGETVGYAWCAWDTLFLPLVLGRTLDVTATDGRSGETVTLRMAPHGPESVEPVETLVSFLAPHRGWDADLLTSFCHKVLFFTGRHNADAWIAEQSDELFTLGVDEAFEVGRRWVADRYGDALSPQPG